MPTKPQVEAYDLRYADVPRCPLRDGAALYYEQRGAGRSLTLINNMFLISPLWRNFTSRLESTRALLTYDLRNQGASTQQDDVVTVDEHVDDLCALLDHLGIAKTVLLGTSESTLIARAFAAQHPDRVSALILVGPSFSPYGSRRRELFTKSWLKALEAGGPAELFGHIYPQVFGDRAISEGKAPAYLALKERFLALNSAEQLRANLATSFTAGDDPETLAHIACPTLLLAGDDDFIASRCTLEEIASRLADATVAVIPYAGHVPFFDAPDAFQDTVARFLMTLEARVMA